MGYANRGKDAEKKVSDWLKLMNTQIACFAWYRFPDARSAMGRMKAAPADFLVSSPAGVTFLEVKETEHDYRLGKDDVSQLPELKKWQLAGCRAAVLIYHKKIKSWRCIDVKDMPSIERGSWDFRGEPLFPTCQAAFENRYKMTF